MAQSGASHRTPRAPWGRKGRIAKVAYDHDTTRSSVALDDDRGGFEALLSRYAVVVGEGSS
jgi:hypothetical protein